jgi:hypothetical protein
MKRRCRDTSLKLVLPPKPRHELALLRKTDKFHNNERKVTVDAANPEIKDGMLTLKYAIQLRGAGGSKTEI